MHTGYKKSFIYRLFTVTQPLKVALPLSYPYTDEKQIIVQYTEGSKTDIYNLYEKPPILLRKKKILQYFINGDKNV